MNKYNSQTIEPKWQKYWENHPELFEADEKSKKPSFYCLDMFPYPSGDGLHVGHVEGYTASDIYSRYLRMRGENVLHPMGWDAFGLPAENYAIKSGIHPAKSTRKNIRTFKKQIKSIGLSYDWSREIDTASPDYYKWTQWFFLFLYKNGLAYRKKAKVNWCESCKTVLANEQVEGGRCERCKKTVIQKDLEQWFFKITDFAEDLIKGLDKVDWPESTKTAQRNWIGKSEGAIVNFEIFPRYDLGKKWLEVFTTRLDTIYGCTYCVVAPEHEIIKEVKSKIENLKEVEKYVNQAKKKTDLQRTDLAKEKTGVEIKGLKAINPFTNEAVPIFVADYVLSTYGTGAVMAVPAHDERDWEFAKKYKLPIKHVILLSNKEREVWIDYKGNDFICWKSELIRNEFWWWKEDYCYTGEGLLFNSGKYSGMTSEKARSEMSKWLKENNLGGKKITYKLHDWLISRQRYWGAPIPMIYCEKCKWQPVTEKDLPVLLPEVKDYRPKGTSPLGTSAKFVNTKCPRCGGSAKRETDTMDTFVCSSWYFFRFADPKNKKEFANRAAIEKWLPVDLYMGGAEHTVLHLLYSRFFTKALYKYKKISFDEPFAKLRHQGIVLAEDGRKMSKSLGNVINPDEITKKYGADTLRLYEMFMGPLEDSKAWNTKSIIGLQRFLERVWRLRSRVNLKSQKNSKIYPVPQETTQRNVIKNPEGRSGSDTSGVSLWHGIHSLLHKTIKKVTEDIENLRFNTAISAMMILVNEMEKEKNILLADYQLLIRILSPFAPHIAEEIWAQLGHKTSIFEERWPEYDEKLAKNKENIIIVQVNGKLRDQVQVSSGIDQKTVEKTALKREKIAKYVQGKKIRKVIFVKDRLINFVV